MLVLTWHRKVNQKQAVQISVGATLLQLEMAVAIEFYPSGVSKIQGEESAHVPRLQSQLRSYLMVLFTC